VATIFQALRSGLVRRPGVTLLAIATLALGTGANTAMFTVANAVLVRPLPYPEANRLVAVWSSPLDASNRSWPCDRSRSTYC